jgi:hypothetical protein
LGRSLGCVDASQPDKDTEVDGAAIDAALLSRTWSVKLEQSRLACLSPTLVDLRYMRESDRAGLPS